MWFVTHTNQPGDHREAALFIKQSDGSAKSYQCHSAKSSRLPPGLGERIISLLLFQNL